MIKTACKHALYSFNWKLTEIVLVSIFVFELEYFSGPPRFFSEELFGHFPILTYTSDCDNNYVIYNILAPLFNETT